MRLKVVYGTGWRLSCIAQVFFSIRADVSGSRCREKGVIDRPPTSGHTGSSENQWSHNSARKNGHKEAILQVRRKNKQRQLVYPRLAMKALGGSPSVYQPAAMPGKPTSVLSKQQ
ncbi:hypothetical protein MRX96_015444 [Rhipicephalus microplus]